MKHHNKSLPALLVLREKNQEESSMLERRRVKRRRYKAHTYFPAIDHQGDFIMSDRRHQHTRRLYDTSAADINFSTNLVGTNKQV
jgi:hypothetical protein